MPSAATTWFDRSQDAAGALVLRGADGTHRTEEGQGESALGRILKDEPRMLTCVTRKIWELAFGTGVKLPPDAEADVRLAFTERGSFRDGLRVALEHPWFWSTVEPPPLVFDDIKNDIRVCSTCHKPSGSIEPRFDVAHYPFRTDAVENADLLRRIWGAANRRPGFRPMPEPPLPQLAADALARLRDWILAGAIDETGTATLTDEKILGVLDE